MDSKTSKILAIGFFAVVGGIVTTAVYKALRGKKSPETTSTTKTAAATPKSKPAETTEVESTLNTVWEKALEGKEEEAKALLEKLMTKYPNSFQAYISYAEISQILTPEFIARARKAATTEYDKLLVEIFDATSKYDFDNTTTLVEEALKKYPNNATLLLMRIPLSVIQKRIYDAREDCDKILENKNLNKFEKSRVYHLKAGTLGQSTEEIPEAIKYLHKSLEEFPNNLSALIDRSTMYLMDEKTSNKASQDAKRALQINDQNAQVHVHNSRVIFALQASQGNPAALESVVKSLEKALSLDPGSIEALTELGNAKYLMGKTDELETALNAFIADSKNAGKEYPHSLKALVLLLTGRFEEAKTLALERIEALSKKDQKREYLFALQTQDPTLMDIEAGIQSYKSIARYASSYLYVFEKIPEFKVMIEKKTDEPEFHKIQFTPAKMEVFTKEEDTHWSSLIDSMWLLIMSQIPFLNSTPELLKMVDEFKGFLKSSFKLKYLTTNAEIIMAAIEAFQSQQARALKTSWELMFTQAKRENMDPRLIILEQIKQMKAMQAQGEDLDVE